MRWSLSKIAIFVGWLLEQDNQKDLKDLETYRHDNKSAAIWTLIVDTKLDKIKPKVMYIKVRDKIVTMIAAYKTLRQKAESTGWGILPADYNSSISIGNPKQKTIQAYLQAKCSWYYDFDNLFFCKSNSCLSFSCKTRSI